jgi:hypothetical protein
MLNTCQLRKDLELGLMHVEVVVLARDIHQFPIFGWRRVSFAKRQANIDHRMIEWSDVLEGAGDRFAEPVDLLVTESECIGIVSGEAKEYSTMVGGLQRRARRAGNCFGRRQCLEMFFKSYAITGRKFGRGGRRLPVGRSLQCVHPRQSSPRS